MMAAVLWSLPLLAAGLLALLRYGFGSVFVVGESVASAILRSAGADIAGTVDRMTVRPFAAMGESAGGLLASGGAAALAPVQPLAAAGLAFCAACWGWWCGMSGSVAILTLAALFGLLAGADRRASP